ncbi:MAG: hypothetical protein WAO98_01210 [Alphaproteobacteria bacterium]
MTQTVHIRFPNSNIPGMQFTSHSENEYPQNGAPCSVVIEGPTAPIEPAKPFNPNPEPPHPFWECVSIITNALNATPDHVNLLPREIDNTSFVSFGGKSTMDAHWDYPNSRNRHVYAGGDNAHIDSIQRDDVAIVADKTMREMRALGLISHGDYEDGVKQMAAQGFAVEPYTGRFKIQSSTTAPTYQSAFGAGLSTSTVAWLKAPTAGRRDPDAGGLAAPVYNAG